MMIHRTMLLTALLVMASLPAWSQGSAAMDQLRAHHTAAEVDQMQQDAHYRYEGELLFYSSSFVIEDNGLERSATEEEIAGIDLHAYDGIRMQEQQTAVHDPLIDKHVVLLGRNEFEQLLLQRLSEVDGDAYRAYKQSALADPNSKTR